ncbi:MAG: DUF2070 family protein, partial [Promethearchaeota archaeon]
WGQETLNTTACALHSTATHDLNLVTRDELTHLLNNIQTAYEKTSKVNSVSQFSRVTRGTIQAGCQLFGDNALILLTRSPHEMDDISLPVGKRISEAVEKIVKRSIIVDTHNCIGELKESVYEDSELIPDMIEAAVKATKQALQTKRGQPRLGVASSLMQEFSELQGMGPEGITAAVIEVMGQKMAYVIIDGNNMVIGLREKLHQELVSHHVDAAEILTTDTHQVTAISTKGEGYSPIGLDIPHASIIQAVKELVEEAKSRLEPVQVDVHIGETEPLHVMGEGTVETLAKLVPLSAKVAKRVGIAVFCGAFLLSLPLLALI